jgi:hypothetical protein
MLSGATILAATVRRADVARIDTANEEASPTLAPVESIAS